MNATFCVSSPLTSLQGPSRHQGGTGSLRMRLDCAPSFGAACIGWAPDRSRGGCLSEHPDAPPWGGDALVLEVNVCWDIRVHTSRRLYSAYAMPDMEHDGSLSVPVRAHGPSLSIIWVIPAREGIRVIEDYRGGGDGGRGPGVRGTSNSTWL